MKRSDVMTEGARGLATLRRLGRQVSAPAPERCDLCSALLPAQHDHLLDPRTRRLRCACHACAILFSSSAETIYRRTPRDIRLLGAFNLSDSSWAGLGIPIALAFLFRSSITGQTVAVYPSPAGPTETEVESDAWKDLLAENPELSGLMPDVEALLINRINGARDYFAVPIDECYKLAGIVRMYWRGFSGGEEAWEQIRGFFEDLKSRSVTLREHSNAESVV